VGDLNDDVEWRTMTVSWQEMSTRRSLHCKVEKACANTLHVKNPILKINHYQNESIFYQCFLRVDIHGTY
jgi:hypothetical protein